MAEGNLPRIEEGEREEPNQTGDSIPGVPVSGEVLPGENTPAYSGEIPGSSDSWRVRYYSDYDYLTFVCATAVSTVCAYKTAMLKINGHDLRNKSPLALLRSGASISVAVEKWLECRGVRR